MNSPSRRDIPLFPHTLAVRAGGVSCYKSFLDVPKDIRDAILFRLDVYSWGQLVQTCRAMRTLGESWELWKDVVTEDLGASAIHTCDQCEGGPPCLCGASQQWSLFWYRTLLKFRFNAAVGFCLAVTDRKIGYVHGGFVRDMIADPLVFRDVDIYATVDVSRAGSIDKVFEKLGDHVFGIYKLRDRRVVRCINPGNQEESTDHVPEYDWTVVSVRLFVETSIGTTVSFVAEFIQDTKLVRPVDVDVNCFYIRDFSTHESRIGMAGTTLGVWGEQVLHMCGLDSSAEVEIELEGAHVRKMAAKVLKITEYGDDHVEPGSRRWAMLSYVINRIISGCADKCICTAMPVHGLATQIVNPPGSANAKVLCVVGDIGGTAVPLSSGMAALSEDLQMVRYGRRISTMRHRGWRSVTGTTGGTTPLINKGILQLTSGKGISTGRQWCGRCILDPSHIERHTGEWVANRLVEAALAADARRSKRPAGADADADTPPAKRQMRSPADLLNERP